MYSFQTRPDTFFLPEHEFCLNALVFVCSEVKNYCFLDPVHVHCSTKSNIITSLKMIFPLKSKVFIPWCSSKLNDPFYSYLWLIITWILIEFPAVLLTFFFPFTVNSFSRQTKLSTTNNNWIESSPANRSRSVQAKQNSISFASLSVPSEFITNLRLDIFGSATDWKNIFCSKPGKRTSLH